LKKWDTKNGGEVARRRKDMSRFTRSELIASREPQVRRVFGKLAKTVLFFLSLPLSPHAPSFSI
jgi:hypothetical protein